MAIPLRAVLFCLLTFLWILPVSAQTMFPKAPPRDPQPPAPEEHSQPIPIIDPFKPSTEKESGPQALTLSQALEVAATHNTDIEVAEYQQKEAYWAYRSASALPTAQLGINYLNGNNFGTSSGGILPDTYVSLSQSLGPLGNLEVGSRAAYQGYEKAKSNVAQVRLSVQQSVKDAFYGLRAAQEQVKLAQDTLDMANRILDMARKRYEQGKSPRMDLVSAGIQQAASEQALITARAFFQQAQDTLNPLLGRAAHTPVEAVGPLELPAVTLVYASLLEQARDNPKILTAVLDLEQNRTQVKLARVQYMPTPSIFYSYDLTLNLHNIGGTLSFPIDFGQTRNAVRQQMETVHEKESALNGVRLSVSSSLKNAYDAYLGAAENARTFRTKVLEPAEEMVKITELGFSSGALPFLNLVTAEQAVKSARTQYVGLLLSGHQALNALEAATGTLLDGDQR